MDYVWLVKVLGLDYFMAPKGFGSKGDLAFVDACLLLILVNGTPKGFFSISRDLRQGDPLSPFLFTLVTGALTQILTRGEEQNLFKGFLIGKEQTLISDLQYADDTLRFLEGGRTQLRNLISLIHCFELI